MTTHVQPQEQAAEQPVPKKRRRDIPLWGYSKLMITWPIAVTGPILWVIDWLGWGSPIALTWIYFGVGLFVFLAGFIDLDRDRAWKWGASIGCLVLLGTTLYFWKDINIFQPIRNYFAEVEGVYSRMLFLKISLAWFVILAFVSFDSWLNHRWVMGDNDIRRKRVIRSSSVFRHAQVRFEEDFYDLLEYVLLFGGGRLRIRRPNGALIAEINHIPFFARKWRKLLDRISRIEVTEDDEADATDDGPDDLG